MIWSDMSSSYIPFPDGTELPESVYVSEMNLAIQICDGYIPSMKVIHTGAGIGLVVDNVQVEHTSFENILFRASSLVLNKSNKK
jgi:hypothetical protein